MRLALGSARPGVDHHRQPRPATRRRLRSHRCNQTAGNAALLDGVSFGSPPYAICDGLAHGNIERSGCEYIATNVLDRNPIRSRAFGGAAVATQGKTRFRYRTCDYPHETEAGRNSYAAVCGCDRNQHTFDSRYPGMTLQTSTLPRMFDPMISDTFSSDDARKTVDRTSTWDWTAELLAIKGTPPPHRR